MYWLINGLFPTSVGINTFLTTTCDGGALLTTQGAHICLSLSFIFFLFLTLKVSVSVLRRTLKS